MFRPTFLFELKFRLKAKSTWIWWALLLVRGVVELLSSEWEQMMRGRVPLNSPFSIYYVLMFSAFWTQILAVGFMTQPLLRDLSTQMAPVVYSRPVTSRGYLLGKYCAALAGLMLVMTGPAFAIILTPSIAVALGLKPATAFIAMPWLHLLHAYLIWVAAGCFIYGTLHFALAALTGRVAWCYALAALAMSLFMFFIANFEGQEFDKPLMQILDPLGKATVEAQIFYWSVEERSRNFLSLSGLLLANRLVYLSLGAAALALAVWRFDLRKLLERMYERDRRRAKRAQPPVEAITGPIDISPRSLSEIEKSGISVGVSIRFALRSGWGEFARLFRLWPFRIVVFAMAAFTPLSAADAWYPKPEGQMLPAAPYAFKLVAELMFAIIELAMLFFAGEILGREKTARVSTLIDSSPMPVRALFLGKLWGVVLLVVFCTLMFPFSVLVVQLSRGYIETSPMLYLHSTLLVLLPAMLCYALFGLFCYAVFNSKAAAQMGGLFFAFLMIVLHETGAITHRMLQYGLPPESAWSDFDVNGMAVERYVHVAAYWLALAGLMTVISYWLWPRGTEARFSRRLKRIQQRAGPASVVLAAACLLLFSFFGWRLYLNINLLNEYKTSDEESAEKADYERKYSALEGLPQPKIIDAKLAIDLAPAERRADYSAVFVLQNKTNQPIDELHLETAEHVALHSFSLDERSLTQSVNDLTHRHLVYRLAAPLAPGEKARMEAKLSVEYRGFGNEGINGALLPDGSIFKAELLPAFGYDRRREITSPGERRKHGLPARHSLPSVTLAASTPEFARDLAANDDADFVAFEAVISTDAGQVIAAPGRMVSDEARGGRRVFTYRRDAAGLWNLHFTSAPYTVVKGEWRGERQTIAIEVFHHPDHAYNVERFIEAARFSLAQLTRDFGDYPYDTIRIAEVPNELIEPTTSGNLILLPEKKGWLHDYRNFDGSRIDFVQYITAREIARGWWGQQAAPARVQGWPLLSDSMPIYAALTVLAARRGEQAAMRQIATLTDGYLRESAIEEGREPALLEADDQEYARSKGAILLYGARNAISADRMNQALRQFLAAARSRRNAPFLRADEFVAALKRDQKNEPLAFLSDAFGSATVYDYKLSEAVAKPATSGRYRLRLQIEAKKFQATESDNRVEVSLNDPLEIAVFPAGNPQQPIMLQTPPLKSGGNQVEIEVAERPLRVVLDPRRNLIDRNLMDNAETVRMQ